MEKIRRDKTVFSLLTVLTILTVCSIPTAVAQPAPDFWISNLASVRFDSRITEQPIVISFFEINCLPCKKEIPQLYQLFITKRLDVSLLFIDPSGTDTREEIQAYAARIGVPSAYFYHDVMGRLGKKFFEGVFVFPTIVGIKNKQIVFCFNELNDQSIPAVIALGK